jgi:hypothetical protein
LLPADENIAAWQTPDYDRLRKSCWREDPFNRAWLKDGEKLSWMQRIGFAVVSFIFLFIGLFIATMALNTLLKGELLSAGTLLAVCGIPLGLFFLVVGILGLRNVLRF